ncbi:MAG TPA: class I SAM-dependent methyltransferase, partial [Candidatus Dormibacteraeota bacterium]|nr:class I SAM-dependent methyltransferase [Candidatus Dormibacteraeota bacterium]
MSRPGTGSRSSRRPDPRPARVRPTQVRDDPAHPDPAFADLYAALPEAHDLWPWLDWGLDAEPPVLYLGIGAGRLAAPLSRAGIELVGIDAHPRMLEHIRRRIPGIELHQTLIADMALGPRFDLGFDLIVGPSSILTSDENLAAAVRHLRPGGRIGMELMNPWWLESTSHDGVRLDAAGTLEVDYRLPDGSVVVQVVENWSPGPAPGDAKDRLERFGLDLLWLGGR